MAPSLSKPLMTVRRAQAAEAARGELTSFGTLMTAEAGGAYWYSANPPRRYGYSSIF
jgi:hypothetical protein